MSQFEELGLSAKMLKAVSALGYEEPTPVQAQAIPLVLEGRDIIASAQTGTGKTAAFCLPCMDGLGHAGKHCGPLMLVVTPTRELADQIGEVCTQVAKITNHKITQVVGGVSYNPQREAFRRGIDVLIATPGRLEDLLNQDVAQLDQVKTVVLDEADRMLDMGFLPAIKRIVKSCTGKHQTLLFSATIDKNVEKIANSMLRNPAEVEIAHRGETAETVDQYIVRISHAAKPDALKAILAEHGARRVIVFARTRHRVDAAARKMRRSGYKVGVIHSGRAQNQRRNALAAFDKGDTNILIATDVLARGIDIDQVDYVVNYDLPAQAEDYVHRIGRTGRAGAEGFAVSLVNPEVEDQLKDIEKLIKMKLPEMELPGFDRETAEAEAAARGQRFAQEQAAAKGGKADKGPTADAAQSSDAVKAEEKQSKPKRKRRKNSSGKGNGAGQGKKASGEDSTNGAQRKQQQGARKRSGGAKRRSGSADNAGKAKSGHNGGDKHSGRKGQGGQREARGGSKKRPDAKKSFRPGRYSSTLNR